MLKVGNLTPANYMKFGGEEYPDLFKLYNAYYITTTATTASAIRRPHLFGSLNLGANWVDECPSTSGPSNFYNVNYGGNLYWNSRKEHLEAWGHKSINSSYGAYSGSVASPIITNKTWSFSSVIPYNTANQISRYLERSHSTEKPNRYFCVKTGGGYAYNDDPWYTKNWTTTNFGTGFQVVDGSSGGGGFKMYKLDPENDHYGLFMMNSDSTNKYIRTCLIDTDNLTLLHDYTTTIWGTTTRSPSDYQYYSVEYLPKVGYLIVYKYRSNVGFQVRILRTYDETTGEKLSYDQYVLDSHGLISVGTSNNNMLYLGARMQYCPWSKEMYFAPNAYQVFWTKDGINWNSSTATGKSASTKCQKLFVDGQNIVVAVDELNFVYSRDKGQTWASKSYGSSISSNQGIFFTERSNDCIVLPYKCVNNIGINKNNVTIGYWLNDTNGNPTASVPNFYTNDYIPIDPSTSYVFFGRRSDGLQAYSNRITFYDSNKNWISTVEGNNGNWYDGWPAIATSPSNAAYARISCRLYFAGGVYPTQEQINATKFYFAKESDFKIMTNYGDLYGN